MKQASLALSLILALLVVALTGTTVYFYRQSYPSSLPATPVTQPTTMPEKSFGNSIDETAGWKTYTNTRYNFTLQYPQDFQVLYSEDGINPLSEGKPKTLFSLERDRNFSNSHLGTRRLFLVEQIPNLTSPSTCYITDDSKPLPHSQRINGMLFYYSNPYGGAAAGSHDTNIAYKVFNNNTCIGIRLTFIEISDWNDPNDTILAQKDKTMALADLNQILSTFKFISTSACNGDQEFCKLETMIRSWVEANNFSQLPNYQLLSQVTCWKTGIQLTPLCDNKPDGTILSLYQVGRNQSEGDFLDSSQLINYMKVYIEKNGPFYYKGTIFNEDKGVIIFVGNTLGNNLLAFWLKKVNGQWRIVIPIVGVASKDYLNLEERTLDYISQFQR